MTVDPFTTPERRALRETVTRFVTAEVLPHQDAWERGGLLPRSLHLEVTLVEAFHEAGGAAGVSLLVVERDTPGFAASAPLDKMGWRSSDTAELTYAGVRVPTTHLVGAPATVSRRSRCTSSASGCPSPRRRTPPPSAPSTSRSRGADCGRRSVAPSSVGSACRPRSPRWPGGSRSPGSTPAGSPPARRRASSTGSMREAEVERQFRDMRILGIGGGTSEILTGLAAKTLGHR